MVQNKLANSCEIALFLLAISLLIIVGNPKSINVNHVCKAEINPITPYSSNEINFRYSGKKTKPTAAATNEEI